MRARWCSRNGRSRLATEPGCGSAPEPPRADHGRRSAARVGGAAWSRDVDSLLRGRFTRPIDLGAGRIDVPVRRLVIAAVAMGALYGAFMGLFAALRGGPDGARQLAASVVKVPLLFLLTLVVTFP